MRLGVKDAVPATMVKEARPTSMVHHVAGQVFGIAYQTDQGQQPQRDIGQQVGPSSAQDTNVIPSRWLAMEVAPVAMITAK